MINETLFIFLILIIFSINNVSAITTFGDGSISKSPIFKCQPTTIYANFTDYGDIISVYTILSNKDPLPKQLGTGQSVYGNQELLMTNNTGGKFSLIYANTNTTPQGNKKISFKVYNGSVNTTYVSSIKLVVAPDACSGSSITNYTQLTPPSGMGKYFNVLWQHPEIGFEFAIYPFIEIIGYVFYVIILFVSCVIVYLGTKNVMVPVAGSIFALFGLVSLNIIPAVWVPFVLFAFVMGFAAVIYRLIVRK